MGAQREAFVSQGLDAAAHVHDQLQQRTLCAVADPCGLTCRR